MYSAHFAKNELILFCSFSYEMYDFYVNALQIFFIMSLNYHSNSQLIAMNLIS
jgi:hypothetical protein